MSKPDQFGALVRALQECWEVKVDYSLGGSKVFFGRRLSGIDQAGMTFTDSRFDGEGNQHWTVEHVPWHLLVRPAQFTFPEVRR